MKGIVLCSGGLDSTLALLRLLKDGHEVVPMFVDYNQWSLEGEEEAVDLISTKLAIDYTPDKCKPLVYIKVRLFESAMFTRDKDEEKVGSVWGRNIALVGLATMWAYTHGDDYGFIALGLHKGDVGPDCKPGGLFEADLDHVLRDATKSILSLVLPIKELTIEDIGKELTESDIPWDLMYSCYWWPPCGYKSVNEEYRCPGCRRKVVAMKAAAKGDTGLYQHFQKRLFKLPNCKEITYQSYLAEKVGY